MPLRRSPASPQNRLKARGSPSRRSDAETLGYDCAYR